MGCRILILAFCVGGLSPAAPVPKAIRKRPATDGVWRLVEYASNGIRERPDVTYWRIEGDRMTMGKKTVDEALAETTTRFTLRVRDPNHSHLRELVWDEHTSVSSAAIELNGDHLKLCVANDPLTVVTECRPMHGTYYYEFERERVKRHRESLSRRDQFRFRHFN